MLDCAALRASSVTTEPFPYFVTPHFLSREDVDAAIRDFPKIDMGGLFLPESFAYGSAFARLLKELEGPQVRRIVEEKLGVDLEGKPTMITLRANCQAKDGRIHADATFKLATLLLYLNEDWADMGGRLRALRSGTDIEDYAAEVAPQGGLAFCFRVQPNSWHGHKALHRPAPLRDAELLQRSGVARPRGRPASVVEPGEEGRAAVGDREDSAGGVKSLRPRLFRSARHAPHARAGGSRPRRLVRMQRCEPGGDRDQGCASARRFAH